LLSFFAARGYGAGKSDFGHCGVERLRCGAGNDNFAYCRVARLRCGK
jgi:hypothetical protein